MKRLVLLLLLIFPFSLVMAEEESSDKLIIDEMKIGFTQTNDKSFYVEEEYDTTLIFGRETKGNFFEKKLSRSYNCEYLNKKFDYTYRYGQMKSDMADSIKSEKDVDTIRFESYSGVLDEKKNIMISYHADLKESNEKSIYYVMGNNEYTTNKLFFSIFINDKFEDKTVLFSIDGKEYVDSLSKLKIEYVGKQVLQGTYTNKLSPNTGIHVLMTEESEIPVKKASEGSFDIMIPIYIALGVLSIAFVFVILSKKKKVTKQ